MQLYTNNNGPELLSVNITIGCHDTHFYQSKYRPEISYVWTDP